MPRPGRESINFKLPQDLVVALHTAFSNRETTATDFVNRYAPIPALVIPYGNVFNEPVFRHFELFRQAWERNS